MPIFLIILKTNKFYFLMSELVIKIDAGSSLEIYGAADKHLNLIKELFPKLKIIARGDLLKLIGDLKEIETFEKRFDLLLLQFDKFGKITEESIKSIMGEEFANDKEGEKGGNNILVYGRHGKLIRALTPNQKRWLKRVLTTIYYLP